MRHGFIGGLVLILAVAQSNAITLRTGAEAPSSKFLMADAAPRAARRWRYLHPTSFVHNSIARRFGRDNDEVEYGVGNGPRTGKQNVDTHGSKLPTAVCACICVRVHWSRIGVAGHAQEVFAFQSPKQGCSMHDPTMYPSKCF